MSDSPELEDIARLLALIARQGCESQADAIREFSAVGFPPRRIAELLGTTANTVSVTLSKAKRSAAPASRARGVGS